MRPSVLSVADPAAAAPWSDVVILAVARALVPLMEPGAILMTPDPAALLDDPLPHCEHIGCAISSSGPYASRSRCCPARRTAPSPTPPTRSASARNRCCSVKGGRGSSSWRISASRGATSPSESPATRRRWFVENVPPTRALRNRPRGGPARQPAGRHRQAVGMPSDHPGLAQAGPAVRRRRRA